MTLIVSCLFAGCDSLANKSEDKLSGDDFWAQGNETNAEAFLLSIAKAILYSGVKIIEYG